MFLSETNSCGVKKIQLEITSVCLQASSLFVFHINRMKPNHISWGGKNLHRIDWDDSFSVGQDKIDEQHRAMMRLINSLNDYLITSYISGDESQLNDLLEIIYEYALKHFTYEEMYMTDIRYPRIVQHVEIHEDIRTQINHFYIGIKEGSIVLDSTIILKFSNMLKDHIIHEDIKYARFAEENVAKK